MNIRTWRPRSAKQRSRSFWSMTTLCLGKGERGPYDSTDTDIFSCSRIMSRFGIHSFYTCWLLAACAPPSSTILRYSWLEEVLSCPSTRCKLKTRHAAPGKQRVDCTRAAKIRMRDRYVIRETYSEPHIKRNLVPATLMGVTWLGVALQDLLCASNKSSSFHISYNSHTSLAHSLLACGARLTSWGVQLEQLQLSADKRGGSALQGLHYEATWSWVFENCTITKSGLSPLGTAQWTMIRRAQPTERLRSLDSRTKNQKWEHGID